VSSKSHKNFYYGLIEAMVAEGHHVTLITPYAPSRSLPRVEEVTLPDNDIEKLLPNPFHSGGDAPMAVQTIGPKLCFDALAAPHVAEAMRRPYDLVLVSMFFNDCFLPALHARQIPFGLVLPGGCFGPFCEARLGLPYFPSLEDNPILGFDDPQGFLQRAASSVLGVVIVLVQRYFLAAVDSEGAARGLYPPGTPPLWTLYKNTSIIITNSFPLGNGAPRPAFPNFLEAGGLQCKEAKPLPADLEEWVSGSKEAGFIFFSLGSAVRGSDLSEERLQILMAVFGRLPQRVLWKFDRPALPGLPPNVRLTEWAPQQDLLAHPALRLFITHGGLHSTQEATYHGAPVLGLPVFGDQHTNMARAQREGWGRLLQWDDLTEESLGAAIQGMMADHGARAVARRVGALLRDRPHHPAGEVGWWAGYLMRTGGARHLWGAARTMPWHQVYNVDVWLAIAALLAAVSYLLARCLCLCCCRRKQERAEKFKIK